jgi:hypothetical protein
VNWCAQGDDFRTFLNHFVADLKQFEVLAHLRFTIGVISSLLSEDLNADPGPMIAGIFIENPFVGIH